MADKKDKTTSNEKDLQQRAQQAKERVEARQMRAGERGARVIVPQTPETVAMVQNVEQLDTLLAQVKQNAGTFGQVSEKKSQDIHLLCQEIIFKMAELGELMAKVLPRGARYRVPRTMEKAYKAYQKAQSASSRESAEEASEETVEKTVVAAAG